MCSSLHDDIAAIPGGGSGYEAKDPGQGTSQVPGTQPNCSRDTYLSAQFWRLARRIGKKKAAVAVGHSILVICWHLLTNDCDYEDLGGDYFTKRTNPDRRRDHHIAQLQDLGYNVTLRKVA